MIDDLTVDRGTLAAECWPASWSGLLDAVHGRQTEIVVEIERCEALASGDVVSDLAKERILGTLGTALPGFR